MDGVKITLPKVKPPAPPRPTKPHVDRGHASVKNAASHAAKLKGC